MCCWKIPLKGLTVVSSKLLHEHAHIGTGTGISVTRKEGQSIGRQFEMHAPKMQMYLLHANLASFLSFTKEWEEEEPPDTQENVDTEEREEVESALVGEIVEDEEVDTTQEVENQSGKTSITIDTTIIYYYYN